MAWQRYAMAEVAPAPWLFLKFNWSNFIIMKKSLLLFCMLISVLSHSQEVLDVTFEGNLSQGFFSVVAITLGVDFELSSGADLYRMTYTTTGSDNAEDIASGLLILPDNITGPMPIINYQHGTTDGRDAVPSNQSGQEFLLAAAFSTMGFIAYAPDYIGMGTSRGFHPYVHAETEARASIDMLSAVKSYLASEDIAFTDQLFITGYSQGGHAAMAAHRMIEQELSDELTVTASLPMSGPYDISGIMTDILFTDQEFFFPSYIVYSTLGLQAVNPNLFDDISEVFRPEFLDIIRPFAETGNGLGAMNRQLIDLLQQNFGTSLPRFLLKDEMLDILQNDDDHPFTIALRENDVFDWSPEAPVLMLYCEGDDQVPFENSLKADSIMNLRGAVNTSSMSAESGVALDHNECISPALTIGVPWLLSFVDQTTSTDDVILNPDEITVYPNPAADQLNISIDIDGVHQINLIDMTGRVVWSISTPNHQEIIDVREFNDGVYVIQSVTDEFSFINRIIIQ
jgi:hypothetical protein